MSGVGSQANMDARHRDKVAFIRVCSGRFEKGMKVRVARTGAPKPCFESPPHQSIPCGMCSGGALQLLVYVPGSRHLTSCVLQVVDKDTVMSIYYVIYIILTWTTRCRMESLMSGTTLIICDEKPMGFKILQAAVWSLLDCRAPLP